MNKNLMNNNGKWIKQSNRYYMENFSVKKTTVKVRQSSNI